MTGSLVTQFVFSSTKSSWSLVTISSPEAMILFNVFNNNLDDGIKYILSKFVDGSWRMVEILESGSSK